jgi:hypothetical protein
MMVGVLCYFEWEVVRTTLRPIKPIVVSIIFIVLLLLNVVIQAALMIIGPIAMLAGADSRDWPDAVLLRLISLGRGSDG